MSTMRDDSERFANLTGPQWIWHRTLEGCCTFTRDEAAPVVVSLSEFLVFFLSKFLLEVCGAAGAVWGIGEILNFRRVENTDDFRGVVTFTFVIFLGRFYWHAKHVWQFGSEYPHAKPEHRRSHWVQAMQIFGATFILQVCGAAGAVWGASETTGLRHSLNRDQWQIAAWVTTFLFGIRWMMTLFSYCLVCRRSQRSRFYNVLKNQILPLVEITITKFVLEVCGSTGAVWGFADMLAIRDQSPKSSEGWRNTALVIGSIFLARWILSVKEYLLLGEESPLVTEPPAVGLQQTSSTFASEEEDEEEIRKLPKRYKNGGSMRLNRISIGSTAKKKRNFSL